MTSFITKDELSTIEKSLNTLILKQILFNLPNNSQILMLCPAL
jgi:hypothetical protein